MKKGEIIGLVIFICFILWVLISRNVNQSDLLQSGKVVNAKIVSWAIPSKGGTVYSFFCEFEYKGKNYKLRSPTTYKGNFDKVIGKSFPGIFSEKVEILEILITSEDFKKFDIPFPDSLEWVRQDEFRRER